MPRSREARDDGNRRDRRPSTVGHVTLRLASPRAESHFPNKRWASEVQDWHNEAHTIDDQACRLCYAVDFIPNYVGHSLIIAKKSVTSQVLHTGCGCGCGFSSTLHLVESSPVEFQDQKATGLKRWIFNIFSLENAGHVTLRLATPRGASNLPTSDELPSCRIGTRKPTPWVIKQHVDYVTL